MKKLEYRIKIAGDSKKVWETMLHPETYKEWANASWPGSYFEGVWKQGENLKFISPGQGGTLAALVEHRPYEYILAKHTAVLHPDGSEDRESGIAKSWIGITESYTFSEINGETELLVQINTRPDWEKMFNNGWPNALLKLKEICEQ